MSARDTQEPNDERTTLNNRKRCGRECLHNVVYIDIAGTVAPFLSFRETDVSPS